jgi:hypothetical protein
MDEPMLRTWPADPQPPPGTRTAHGLTMWDAARCRIWTWTELKNFRVSLYERLARLDAINAVVDSFVARAGADDG